MRNWLSAKIQKELHVPKGFSCARCEKPRRCCDFTPFIPNFLAGRMNLRNIIVERLSPIGIFPRAQQELCDFFNKDEKTCQVWEARPSECASYFCDSFLEPELTRDRSQWLFEVEFSLAQMAMIEMGFTHIEVGQWVRHWTDWLQYPESSPRPPWPKWLDDPETYYQKCSKWVDDLDWKSFAKDLSPHLREGFDKHLHTPLR